MIDFHTHILPNVDDGSKSIEETIELIKEANKVGFKAIISTSHYIESYYEVNVLDRKNALDLINNNLKMQNIDMKLYLGNEVYFSNNIIELLKKGAICTINDTRYILFELPMNTKPINLFDVVYEMMENKLIPILAHPERYQCVHQNPSLVSDLIEKGVLMQSNYGSIIGQYGKKAKIIVEKLLINDMVHFLGTDVHSRNVIYPKIPQIIEKLENLIGKEKLDLISNINPSLTLQDKPIEIEEPVEVKLSFIEKMIMRK